MQITLYQFEQCPFCVKVRDKLDKLNLKYEIVNVPYERENPKRKLLYEKTGIHTVPIIKIDEKWIGDSDKIIEYLETMFK